MAKPKKPVEPIQIERGAEKRLANILNKALNTRPKHVSDKRTKSTKKGGKA